jgi:hypothetical protein
MNNERINKMCCEKKSYHRKWFTGKPYPHVENNLKSKPYRFGEKNMIFFSKNLDFEKICFIFAPF